MLQNGERFAIDFKSFRKKKGVKTQEKSQTVGGKYF